MQRSWSLLIQLSSQSSGATPAGRERLFSGVSDQPKSRDLEIQISAVSQTALLDHTTVKIKVFKVSWIQEFPKRF